MAVNPHSSQLAADLITIDLKAKGIDAALETAHRLQSDDPNLLTAPALQGDAYMAAEQYAKASDAYAKALQQKPSTMLLLRLARAKAAAGDTDAGISLLSDWLKDNSTETGVAEVLASFEITQHRYDDATKHLEQAVATGSPSPAMLNNLAWLYQRVGDPRARSLAQRAYLLAPQLPQVADTLGWLLVQQKAAVAGLELLEEARSADAQSVEIQYHLAVAFNDTGHRDKAIEVLKALTADNVTFDDKPSAVKLFGELTKN
jgi:tetratricopeptide (TPR) repeat protein